MKGRNMEETYTAVNWVLFTSVEKAEGTRMVGFWCEDGSFVERPERAWKTANPNSPEAQTELTRAVDTVLDRFDPNFGVGVQWLAMPY